MASVSAACFHAALLVLAAGVVADLPEEDCKASEVSLLQKEFRIQALEADAGGQATGSKILIVGDSNAAFAGPTAGMFAAVMPNNTLQDACGGSTVVNKGDAGTKVSAWNASDFALLKNAVNSQTGWTHVWLSIGANDLSEDYKCAPSKGAIKAGITGLINVIKNLTTAKIVLTGYTVSPADDTCNIAAMRENVGNAMKEVAASDPKVTFVSIATAADAVFDAAARASANCSEAVMLTDSKSPNIGKTPCRGDKKWFMNDLIHLNAQGYRKAWTLPAVQAAFGCNSSLTPPPVTPPVTPPASPPVASPPVSPPASCQNNDASIIAAAASINMTITGCVDVQTFCTHLMYGLTVQANCPTFCNTACR
jgi:lysophospholipase L1-like esterase